MICPYFISHGSESISCQRGYVRRTTAFVRRHKKDKHFRTYCNCKYTECRTYKKLEADWGSVKCSGSCLV